MRTLITVKGHFSAAHRLYNPEWDMQKNDRVFGMCNNPNGHGHNYAVDVVVEGSIGPETGMVTDMKALKDLLEEEVLRHVDHKHLNFDVPFLEGMIPTAENLAMAFWNLLEPKIKEGSLYEIRVHESERNSASVRR